jgi:hypothetical protein
VADSCESYLLLNYAETRGQDSFPTLIRTVLEHTRRWRPSHCDINIKTASGEFYKGWKESVSNKNKRITTPEDTRATIT